MVGDFQCILSAPGFPPEPCKTVSRLLRIRIVRAHIYETCNRRITYALKHGYICAYVMYFTKTNGRLYSFRIEQLYFTLHARVIIVTCYYHKVTRMIFFRLLIGAPEAQTAQPGVEKGGAVFRCGTSRENDCDEIPFDTRGEFSHARRLQCVVYTVEK